MDLPRLHFSRDEYRARLEKTRGAIAARRLDGLLLFKIEDMYWLTGLDTDGYYVFNAMYVGADGRIEYLTRRVDYANALYSSIVENYRFWEERADTPRGAAIKAMLADLGLQGRRIGIQLNTLGMRADLYLEVQAALDGFCTLVEASDVVGALRRIKSEAEIAHMRKAAAILAKMTDAALAMTRPGAFEGDILAELYAIVYRNDGDPSALRYPTGCGAAANNARYTTGRHHVAENDHFMYEIGCAYRHYHAAVFFIALTGPNPDPNHQHLLDVCNEALEAGQAAMRPGNVIGDIHAAVRRVYEKNGLGDMPFKSLGYNMGATFPPTWVDPPMIIEGEPTVLEEGMVLFLHPAIRVEKGGKKLRMALGEQVVVRGNGVERLTHAPRHLCVCG